RSNVANLNIFVLHEAAEQARASRVAAAPAFELKDRMVAFDQLAVNGDDWLPGSIQSGPITRAAAALLKFNNRIFQFERFGAELDIGFTRHHIPEQSRGLNGCGEFIAYGSLCTFKHLHLV